jgi:BD-FAE protein/galactose oxidase-like protein
MAAGRVRALWLAAVLAVCAAAGVWSPAAAGAAARATGCPKPPKGPTYPLALDEIYGAVNFLHANPSRTGVWDIDPGHIGAVGQSAGAYFSAMLATCTAQGALCPAPQIQAASIWSAPFDLTPLACHAKATCIVGLGGGTIANYLGCYLNTMTTKPCNSQTKLDPTQAYQDASPAHWVTKGAAPMQIWNSDNELIPVSQVSEMVADLHAACAGYRFAVLPGDQHTTYTDIVLPATIAFLKQQLGANPPSLGCTTAPPQTDTATALDPGAGGTGGEVVAFGGCCNTDGSLLDDTWTLTNGKWALQHPRHSPPARIGASMAFDPSTKQVILFGGDTASSSCDGSCLSLSDQTWEWTRTGWQQLSPTQVPAAREFASMAATPTGLVMFGGLNGTSKGSGGNVTDTESLRGDTWVWSNGQWARQSPPASPPALYSAGPASSSVPGSQAILAGGFSTGLDAYSPASYLWTGSTWNPGPLLHR